jgi:hypothetical protein
MRLKRRKKKHIYQSLINKIELAFCDLQYPGDDKISGSQAHLNECEECRDIHNSLVSLAGKTWQEALENTQLHGKILQAMSFCAPEGWQYYLPAYLIQLIRKRVFWSIPFLPGSTPGLMNFIQKRADLLNADQCEAVVEYLMLVQENDCRSDVAIEHNEIALSYWQENLRKAIYEA